MKLSAHGVEQRYEERVVLFGVEFALRGGELVGVVGPNGAGKSTLLRRLSGTLHGPGVVLLDGQELTALSPRALARSLGMLEQEVQSAFDFRVEELVAFGRHPRRSPWGLSQDDREAVAKAMEALGIVGEAARHFSQLSGGERRKVLLAMVLAQEPEVLLLDEPTAHLDVRYQLEIMGLLAQLTQEGKAVACALHDLNLAAAFAKRLLLLGAGRVLAQGSAAEVLTPARLRDAFGVEALVRRNPATGSVYVHFLPPRSQAKKEGRVLVIGGGGAAAPFLPPLDARYEVLLGVVSPLDTDYEMARGLGLPVIDEAPFAPVSAGALARLREELARVDAVVICPVWVGPGNLSVLASLEGGGRPIYIVDPEGFPARDHTGGEATEIFRRLRHAGAVGVAREKLLQLNLVREGNGGGEQSPG